MENFMPYSWQASLIEDLKQVPDGRSIFWVYSDGAHDRSALSEYLVRNMGARKAVLSGWPNWNMTDVYNTHFEDDIVLIDCPLNLSSSMKIDFYSLLEALKNGNESEKPCKIRKVQSPSTVECSRLYH